AFAFREYVGARVWWAVLLVTAACAGLSIDFHGAWGISLGALGVLSACVFWGIDNNFTRHISGKDPLTIVMIKGLCAGAVSLIIAFATRQPLPFVPVSLLAMALGIIGYGLSIVLFILALRNLGAARTSTYFAIAPFVGALLSFTVLREAIGVQFVLSLPLLVIGVALLANEAHEHEHTHRAETHEHRHRHDDLHHNHNHDGGELPPDLLHTHQHTHLPIQHTHGHAPDLHHRHEH
ncbi:MAG TPA: EamA family transporter, partial [Armatimonadota bacterium]|nr:EamA family transporter [Armatimonadota bacterium]